MPSAIEAAEYTIDELTKINRMLPGNSMADVKCWAGRAVLNIHPTDIVIQEVVHESEQALSHVGRVVTRFLIHEYTGSRLTDDGEFEEVSYKEPSEISINDGFLLDDRVIDPNYIMPEKEAYLQEAYTYRKPEPYELIFDATKYFEEVPDFEVNGITVDFYIWSYSTDGLLNPYPVYLQATVYADEIYGFIEHFDDLNPETRIEYIEQNEFFQPMHTNIDTGEATYGDWDKWDWLMDVKPYLVYTDRVAIGTYPDIPLDPHDLTKLADGSDATLEVLGERFGSDYVDNYSHMTWIPKLYYKAEVTDTERKVLFSRTKKSSLTDGFQPVGFMYYPRKYAEKQEAEGVYIPIFYATDYRWGWDLGAVPKVSMNINTLLAQDDIKDPGYGGSIHYILRDVEYMLFKSTNVTYHAGEGMTSAAAGVVNAINPNVKDSPVPGFYGTNAAKKEPNCMFYSYVLGSYYIGVWDGHSSVGVVANHLTIEHPIANKFGFGVIPNEDFNHETGVPVNISLPTGSVASGQSRYWAKRVISIGEYGCITAFENGAASATTGLCDVYVGYGLGTTPYRGLLFGWYSIISGNNGPGMIFYNYGNAATADAHFGFALMKLVDKGPTSKE